MGKAGRNRAARTTVAPRVEHQRSSLLTRNRVVAVAAVAIAIAIALVAASLVSAQGADEVTPDTKGR
jgi:hypothetical protein